MPWLNREAWNNGLFYDRAGDALPNDLLISVPAFMRKNDVPFGFVGPCVAGGTGHAETISALVRLASKSERTASTT